MPLMAKAAAQSGAVGIRANTVRDITQIKEVVDLPVIGIIKKDYEGTPMYITVTMKEVDALVACGVEIVAVQGTGSETPGRKQCTGIYPCGQRKIPPAAGNGRLCDVRRRNRMCEAGADLWVLRCVAIHRRQRDVMILIMRLSMNF